uniref:Calcineurin-like phosphoesterase domain-containing protein n=1 Tax=viral metagenome TaxID=1070528 RepID=A0A6M3L8G8_9ZZZZ
MEVAGQRIQVPIGESVDVFLLGDIHEGHVNMDDAALNRAIEIIQENIANNPHTYVILMGDLAECITSGNDPRWDPLAVDEKYDIQDLKDLPKRQIEIVYDYLKPIKDSIVCVLHGNHEENLVKRGRGDVIEYLVHGMRGDEQKPLPNAYKLGYDGFYIFRVELRKNHTHTITFALNHGVGGGGRTEGHFINSTFNNFNNWEGADFYICGHGHRLLAFEKKRLAVDTRNLRVIEGKTWYGMSGCFLRTYKEGTRSYAEGRGWPLSDIGMLKATFSLGRHRNANGVERSIVKYTKLSEIHLGGEL